MSAFPIPFSGFFKPPRLSPAQAQGHAAEDQAKIYLERKGYHFLAANHRTRFGEVDLVMEQGETVVFVEVRERSDSAFGSPVETVTKKKQARIAKAGIAYVKAQGLARRPLRFDIVAVQDARLTHIENAFVPSVYYL